MAEIRNQTTRKYIWGSGQKVTTSGTSAQSTGIESTEIMLNATAAMHIAIGANPTAIKDTAGNIFLSAGEKFHLQINPGEKVAAIQDAATGSLYILPVY